MRTTYDDLNKAFQCSAGRNHALAAPKSSTVWRCAALAAVVVLTFTSVGQGGSISGSNSTDVQIPDAGDWVYSVITISGAPTGAVVTDVDVSFDVRHSYPSDLIIDLEVQDSSASKRLWSYEGGGTNDAIRTINGIDEFDDLNPNRKWYLYARDDDALVAGYINSWSIRIYYTVPVSSPAKPTGLDPSNETITDLTPYLDWNSASGAETYEVNISKYPYGLSNIVYTESGITTSSHTVSSGYLTYGTQYRWDVTAVNSAGETTSDNAYFSTAAALSMPTTLSPGYTTAPGPELATLTPTFDWYDVSGATWYEVNIRNLDTNDLITQQVTSSQYIPSTPLAAGTPFKWDVTAGNSSGESSPSADRYFLTPAQVTLTLYVHADSASGPTLSGVLVTGQDGATASFSKTTNSSGYVTITGTAGTWSFSASKSGYQSNSWNQTISSTGEKHAYLQTKTATQVTLTLYVHADSASGPTLSGVQVTGQDGAAASFGKTTNSSGYVTITGTPGTWSFSASKSGYQPNSWNQTISSTGEKHAYLIATQNTSYSITPNPATVGEDDGTLTFTITRSGSLPAETVYVSTVNGAQHGYATNDGDYETNVNDLPLAFSQGMTQETVTVTILSDSDVESNETFGLIVQKTPDPDPDIFVAQATFTILDSAATGTSDLLVQSNAITASPNPIAAGNNLTVTYTLANVGSAASNSSTTKIQIKRASDNSLLMHQNFSVSALAASGTRIESHTLTLPFSALDGLYRVYVILDNYSTAGQTRADEANDDDAFTSIAIQQPVAATFNIGDRVAATDSLNVRPSVGSTTVLVTQNPGERGEIMDGPQTADYFGITYAWYEIAWDDGNSGWSIQNYLVLAPTSTNPDDPTGLVHNFIASPNYDNRPPGQSIDAIVIHTTEGGYEGSIQRLTDDNVPISERVSAHYVIDFDGRITQLVYPDDRAWHATYYNDRSIGIEMVGYARERGTWTKANLDALQRLVAALVEQYPGIPIVHPTDVATDYGLGKLNVAGIIGHSQVQPIQGIYNFKADPGLYFPWNNIIRKLLPPDTLAPTVSSTVELVAPTEAGSCGAPAMQGGFTGASQLLATAQTSSTELSYLARFQYTVHDLGNSVLRQVDLVKRKAGNVWNTIQSLLIPEEATVYQCTFEYLLDSPEPGEYKLRAFDSNDNVGFETETHEIRPVGQLTFDAEGVGDETLWLHWPQTSKSGVTIGRGYDLGVDNRSFESAKEDLLAAGIPLGQAEAIAAGAGKRGSQAGEFVEANKADIGPITREQQRSLFELIYPGYVIEAERRYEYHRSHDPVSGAELPQPLGLSWDSLHWAIQDVLIDFVYQGYGKPVPDPVDGVGYHRPMRAGMNNSFDDLIQYIQGSAEMMGWEAGRQRIPYLEQHRPSTTVVSADNFSAGHAAAWIAVVESADAEVRSVLAFASDNIVAQLTKGSDAAIRRMVQLSDMPTLNFDYHFTTAGIPGDRLVAKIDETEVWSMVGTDYTGTNFQNTGEIDLSAWAGQTVELEIRLTTTGPATGEDRTQVWIDNVIVESDDIDFNRFVDYREFSLLSDRWLDACAGPFWCGGADRNMSGFVDINDFLALSHIWLSQADNSIPDSTILDVSKVIVKPGRDRTNPEDMIVIQGDLDMEEAAYFAANSISVRIGTNDFSTRYERAIPHPGSDETLPEVKNGRVIFKGVGDPDTDSGQFQLQLIFNKNGRTGRYKIIAKGIDLSGLEATTTNFMTLELSFGSFTGVAELSQQSNPATSGTQIIKSLPMCLLSGIKDVVAVDKFRVTSHPARGDSLTLRGQIAALNPDLDLGAVDVTVRWGDFDETIPAGSVVNKGRGKFLYKQPKGGDGFIKKLLIDMSKCKLNLLIKEADGLQATGSVLFNVEAGNNGDAFSANVVVDLSN